MEEDIETLKKNKVNVRFMKGRFPKMNTTKETDLTTRIAKDGIIEW